MSVLSVLALKLRLTPRMPPVLRLRAVVAQGPAGRDGPRGPQGEIGPPGPPAPPSTALRHEHVQISPAPVWTIAHNLGARPQVAVLTTGGVMMLAGVRHLSENTLQIVLDDPQSGFAICV